MNVIKTPKFRNDINKQQCFKMLLKHRNVGIKFKNKIDLKFYSYQDLYFCISRKNQQGINNYICTNRKKY